MKQVYFRYACTFPLPDGTYGGIDEGTELPVLSEFVAPNVNGDGPYSWLVVQVSPQTTPIALIYDNADMCVF